MNPSRWELRPVLKGVVRALPNTDAGRLVIAGLRRPGAGISYGDTSWSGRRVARKADLLGSWLSGTGVGPEAAVAILMEPSVEVVAGLIGVLRAGAFFLPLDVSLPEERLKGMLAKARPAAVITQRRLLTGLVERLLDRETPVIAIEDVDAAADDANFEPPTLPQDVAAYALYTSGSTGQPRAVVATHRGLVNYLCWRSRETPLHPNERVLSLASTSLDVSLRELLWPLACGAHVVIAPPPVRSEPSALVKLLAAEGINVVHLLPSLLDRLLEEPGVDRLPELRLVHASAEPLHRATQQRFRALLKADLHHSYGPTEATISVTHCLASATSDHDWSPLGAAVDNTELYLLNDRVEPVAAGEPGEIYIGGVALARGYLDEPGLTAARFLPHPSRAGHRLYRTGDRARWHPERGLLWIGRTDDQLKIRGYRVEPAEIEAVLGAHPSVREAAVTTVGNGPAATLVALLALRAETKGVESAAVEDVLAFVRARLPEHLCPERSMTMRALPRTRVGKLDRAGARVLALSERPVAVRKADAALTATEAVVAEIWREVLGVTDLGPHDDFFQLGGHSLSAMLVVGRLRARHSVQVSVRTLFQSHTVRAFAAALDEPGQHRPASSGATLSALLKRRAAAPGDRIPSGEEEAGGPPGAGPGAHPGGRAHPR
jgi:amino acid adenylation domain-containing protein